MNEPDIIERLRMAAHTASLRANVPHRQAAEELGALRDAAAEIRDLRFKLARYTPPSDAPQCDPRARLAYAVMRGVGRERRDGEGMDEHRRASARAGELVLIEVPPNMTIHEADVGSLVRILRIAKTIGEHWRTQSGINGRLLDELADATTPAPAITEGT